MKRTIGLLALLGIALAGCLEMDSFLTNALTIDEYTLPANTIPAHLIEPVTFDSEGNTLHGFWVASDGARPGVSILYCPGNKHNIDAYWDRVMFLHGLGVNLFIFDYRSFGRSEGTFSEAGMHADARAALAYALARPEVSADSLGLYGYSLGNVASIYLAAEAVDPLFLIAEAPFAAASSLTQGALSLGLPAGWLTGGQFDNVAHVRRIDTPFLLLHGDRDDLVRYRDNGRVVFEHAPEPKRLLLVPGAAHDNIPQMMGLDAYLAEVAAWIDASR